MEITTLEIFQTLLIEVRRIEKVIRDILKANDKNTFEMKMKSNLIKKKKLVQTKITPLFNVHKRRSPNKKTKSEFKWKPKEKVPRMNEEKEKPKIKSIQQVDGNQVSTKTQEEEQRKTKNPRLNTSPQNVKTMKENEEKKKYLLADRQREQGNQKFQEKDYDAALQFYQNAIELNPNDARHHANLVNCCVAKNHFEKALEISTKLIADETLEERSEKMINSMIRKTLLCANKLGEKNLFKSYLDIAESSMENDEFEKLLNTYKMKRVKLKKKINIKNPLNLF